MKTLAAPSLLSCVQDSPEQGRCTGNLIEKGAELTCASCEARYPVVNGVPVLRTDGPELADGWFEAMYEGRSRLEELQTEYLEGERALMAELAEAFDLQGPSLEIGCGTGLFADVVPGYVGLEYALESLFVEGFESVPRICGDARTLPVASGSMNCVFSFNTLEHVPEVDRAFGEIDRVLRPGGLLVLKPAWHCARYVTELIHVRPFPELSTRQRVIKALLPLIRSRLFKFLTQVPWRLYRRLNCRPANPLSWGRLEPYHGELWVADADAVASLDCHEGILYYTSRGYECLSHRSTARQLLAGHDVVVLRKGA